MKSRASRFLREYSLSAAVAALPLALAISGATLQNRFVLMAMIASICLAILLVVSDKVGERAYPFVLYSIGLSLLFQVTLFGPYLVGADIHLEYYFAHITELNGWDPSLPYPQNSAFGVSAVIPAIARLLAVDLIWMFKVAVPMMFAFTPVLLYYVFRKWLDAKGSFLASTFFMAVPTYFMELPGIAKQMLAMTCFAFMLWLILDDHRLFGRLRWKVPLVMAAGVLVILNHYSSGILLVYFMAGACLVQGLFRLFFKLKMHYPVWAMALTAIVLAGTAYGYYGWVGEGAPLQAAVAFAPTGNTPAGELPAIVGDVVEPAPAEYFSRHDSLMKTAIGLDFASASGLGQTFRVLQYLTQVLLIVGFFVLQKQRTFYVFGLVGSVLLALCVFYPGFALVLNATRFYHVALLALAPAFVAGGLLIFRNHRALAVVVVIPYLVFTTGIPFELAGHTNTDVVDLPYSVPLTNHRMDLGGSITEYDRAVADYIVVADIRPVYADHFGRLLLEEQVGFDDEVINLKWDFEGVPSGSYLFLRERNVQDQSLTLWSGVGLRRCVPYTDNPGRIVFSAGDAKLMEVE